MRVPPRSRIPVALSSTLAVTAGLVLAAPHVAAATITVTDLTPPPAPVSLSRLQSSQVTVSFQVVSSDGQARPPRVVDTTDGVAFAPVPASLTSGSLANGTWDAVITLGSFMDGDHAPVVRVCTSDTSCVTRSLSTVIEVRGSDWPRLAKVTQRPDRLPAGEVDGGQARGRVVFSSSHDPVPGITVRLSRTAGGAGRAVDVTGAQGRFTSPWPWTRPGTDAARLLLTSSTFPGARIDRTTLGNPYTRFRVARPKAPGVVTPGRRLVVKGIVTPGYPASRLGQVKLQLLTDSGWKTRDRAHVRPVRTGSGVENRARYRLTAQIDQVGRHTLRVVKPAAMCGGGGCRVAGDRSDRFAVVIGNRTYFVERHLDALGVPVGEVDGVVDARSQQAFCAWRDMTGTKPTRHGMSPKLVRSVMRADSLPRPDRTDGLYVNKTCQILLQVSDGKYRRVVWVSSGMSGYDTPNGTGAIFRKVEGWVESTLYPGAFMLDPMFFFPSRPAIAIHGSATNDLVHPYPASHGCVRTWRPQVSEIFDESPIGTKVQVYGHY